VNYVPELSRREVVFGGAALMLANGLEIPASASSENRKDQIKRSESKTVRRSITRIGAQVAP